MTGQLTAISYWTPRALALGLAAFFSLFALDVFAEHTGVWPTLAALAMHLVPAAIVAAALVIAWRWELTGGVIFVALGMTYVVLMTQSSIHWSAHLTVTLPLLLIGLLFVAGWALRRRDDVAAPSRLR